MKNNYIVCAKNKQGACLAEYSIKAISADAAIRQAKKMHRRTWQMTGVKFEVISE